MGDTQIETHLLGDTQVETHLVGDTQVETHLDSPGGGTAVDAHSKPTVKQTFFTEHFSCKTEIKLS